MVKGGVGFLNVVELVMLCYLIENFFDCLCNGEVEFIFELMDIIMVVIKGVWEMFGELGQMVLLQLVDLMVIVVLKGVFSIGEFVFVFVVQEFVVVVFFFFLVMLVFGELDWNVLYLLVMGVLVVMVVQGEVIIKVEIEMVQVIIGMLVIVGLLMVVQFVDGIVFVFGCWVIDKLGG